MTGSVTVVFTPDLATNELVFRLWPNAPVLAASGVHEDVGAITSGGPALAVDQPDVTTVHVSLPTTLKPGESITVTVPYTLTIPGGNADRVAHEGDTMRLGSFLPLLAWEPGVGWATDPATSVHGEAATSPVADYDVAISVPVGYDVLGSGVPGADNHWRATAVRDVGFSVGHFVLAEDDVGGVHITVGVEQSVGEDPARYMSLIADSFRNYPARLGAYPVADVHGRGHARLPRRHRVPDARDARRRLNDTLDRARGRASVVLLVGRERPRPRPVARRRPRVVRGVRAGGITRSASRRIDPV